MFSLTKRQIKRNNKQLCNSYTLRCLVYCMGFRLGGWPKVGLSFSNKGWGKSKTWTKPTTPMTFSNLNIELKKWVMEYFSQNLKEFIITKISISWITGTSWCPFLWEYQHKPTIQKEEHNCKNILLNTSCKAIVEHLNKLLASPYT